ncbi:mitochondrial 54S ribosomal protein mL40 [Kockiozyma suomiensis]|uniref:mitochondrial 54S ribosomal protein mL40 n=1 Tax=Kockiozyma suomiensis TaxID=1337062 RepID=UPI003344393F
MSLHQLSSMFWRRSQTIISRTAFQSAAVSRIPQPLHNFEVSGVKFTHGSLEVTRGKRTKSGGSSPQKIRLVNMLSLIGRVRKAPYRLKLSYEDLLRHRTIHRAWQLVKRQERESRNTELMTQYQKIQVACDELEKASPELFAQAMDKPKSLRFPPEYRIPTETPPNVSWDSSWKKATLPQVK